MENSTAAAAAKADFQNPERVLLGFDRTFGVGYRLWKRNLRNLSIVGVGAAVLSALTSRTDGGEGIVFALLPLLAAVLGARHRIPKSGERPYNPWTRGLLFTIPAYVTYAIVYLIATVGLFFLIVPGVYLYLRLCWAPEFTLLHAMWPHHAIRESWRITRGAVGDTFWFYIKLWLVMLLIVPVSIALAFTPVAIVVVALQLTQAIGAFPVLIMEMFSMLVGVLLVGLLVAFYVAYFEGLRGVRMPLTAETLKAQGWVFKAPRVVAEHNSP